MVFQGLWKKCCTWKFDCFSNYDCQLDELSSFSNVFKYFKPMAQPYLLKTGGCYSDQNWAACSSSAAGHGYKNMPHFHAISQFFIMIILACWPQIRWEVPEMFRGAWLGFKPIGYGFVNESLRNINIMSLVYIDVFNIKCLNLERQLQRWD